MKMTSFRLPEGLIDDMNFVVEKSGTNKSQMVRQGLNQIITNYFQKEKMKTDNTITDSCKNQLNKNIGEIK